jgi:trehalose synthase
MIAAALGYSDITNLAPGQIEKIKQAHLLLAMFNAWQPGVFAVSGWDLCGMLTLERSKVSRLLALGDTRWIHRAAYDLMDYRPEATESPSKMPRGSSLYGSLPQQLRDANSFASRLREILAVRARHGIATSEQVEVPEVSNKAMLVMVHRLDTRQLQLTVLNFSSQPIAGRVKSKHLAPGASVIDMVSDQVIAEVDHDHTFAVWLEPHQGLSLVTDPAAVQDGQNSLSPRRLQPRPPTRHRP